MIGPDLLIAAPPLFETTDDYNATLPSFGWYDFWTGAVAKLVDKRPTNGDLEVNKPPLLPAVRIHPDVPTLPVFVRPGAIIPTAPLVQSTVERPMGPLTLRVFPGPDCAGHLYQDDGGTFAYQHGEFLRMRFTCTVSPADGRLSIHIGQHEGTYPAWWSQIAVQINGLTKHPGAVAVDGHPATFTSTEHSIIVTVLDQGSGINIVVL